MVDYTLAEAAVLRPDPDDASIDVTGLLEGEQVSALREIGPWMKISLFRDGRQFLGWVHSAILKKSEAITFDLFDEPDGQSRSVKGSILTIRLSLPPWQKVDVLIEDGTVESGWLNTASTSSPTVPKGDADAKPEAAGELVLGVNDVYRPHLLLAEERTEIDAAALAAVINAEAAKLANGEWDRNSKASTSTAAGLTQFLAATWLGEAKKSRTYLNEHARREGYVTDANAISPGSEDKLLKLRFEPKMSIVAAAEYGASNLKALIAAGLVDDETGDDEKAQFIYLAHHEGLGGATAFLRGNKGYTFSDLAKQVGSTKAQKYLDAAGGNAAQAYRNWLNSYIQEHIQPERYRKAADVEAPLLGSDAAKELSQYDGTPIVLSEMSRNTGLAKAVQWRLSELGYLDPPADGSFGPVSTWALTEFCASNNISLKNGFNRSVAERLISPAVLLPEIAASGTWFDKVISYMRNRKYFISRHPDCKNIVYLEGANQDGTLNDDAPNKFNDLRIFFRGCLKKKWVISTGCDSFGFAKIRWSSRWPGPKPPVGNMPGEQHAMQAI
ncbi:peptidoglycan-binding domain-containing protein (plasmid) [Rhizobium sp. T1470]|uniref:peptidoglycan-binding domain-containing protein n=1 Tax=unclassified Rhizobium TaxID=2613769 RepID=UPI001AAE7D7B|nr:peptidoglycan-binding domain-containing protein [Rhizobium sp. T1473]MCA0804544.1 peptidoglycan-binding protein [Rhizobium sp. T1473]